MVLTSKKSLKPDIQPKIIDQAKGTKDIIRKIWARKVHNQQKVSKIYFIALFFFGKKTKHVS